MKTLSLLALFSSSLFAQYAPGRYVLVRGSGPQPDFTISASPSTVSLVQGSTATLTATVAASGGFTGVVTPTITAGLSTGVTASACAPATVTTSGSCAFTLTATGSATVGTTAVVVSAVSGGVTRTASASLAVSASGGGPSATPQITVSAATASPGTIDLSAGNPTGWVFYGQTSAGQDYTGATFSCQSAKTNNTQPPCNPGAYKLGGSGITPLYPLFTGNNVNVYGSFGRALSVGFSWSDSAGPSASGSGSTYYVGDGNPSYQIAFESDPTLKTATIYAFANNYYRAGGCFSAAATIHATFHFTDNSVPDLVRPLTSVEGDCSGLHVLTASFASGTSSYMVVTLDEDGSTGGTSEIMAAVLQ